MAKQTFLVASIQGQDPETTNRINAVHCRIDQEIFKRKNVPQSFFQNEENWAKIKRTVPEDLIGIFRHAYDSVATAQKIPGHNSYGVEELCTAEVFNGQRDKQLIPAYSS